MRKETKTIAEYKAPKCKCVELRLTQCLLSVSDPTNENYKDPTDLGGVWEDDED